MVDARRPMCMNKAAGHAAILHRLQDGGERVSEAARGATVGVDGFIVRVGDRVELERRKGLQIRGAKNRGRANLQHHARAQALTVRLAVVGRRQSGSAGRR